MPEKEFSHIRIAILVDGSFFLKRYGITYRGGKSHSAEQVARNFYTMVHKHIGNDYLYRIFYYDCFPYEKKQHLPISKRAKDFSKSDVALFRLEFFRHLKKQRKVALRLGYMKDKPDYAWAIKPEKLREIVNGKVSIADLKDEDFYPDIRQKGVDIKIGLDIASLAYKKLVDRIILISGDSDFVPAAKLARIEGIDFVLDPMWQSISDDLFEHIDGLKSTCERPELPGRPSDVPASASKPGVASPIPPIRVN